MRPERRTRGAVLPTRATSKTTCGFLSATAPDSASCAVTSSAVVTPSKTGRGALRVARSERNSTRPGVSMPPVFFQRASTSPLEAADAALRVEHRDAQHIGARWRGQLDGERARPVRARPRRCSPSPSPAGRRSRRAPRRPWPGRGRRGSRRRPPRCAGPWRWSSRAARTTSPGGRRPSGAARLSAPRAARSRDRWACRPAAACPRAPGGTRRVMRPAVTP